MGKVIFWLVVIFVVLFALRLYNAAKLDRRKGETAARRKPPALDDTMVRCVRCGTYVPKADARLTPGGPTCGDAACLR